MGDCNTCPLYQAVEKFAATSCARGNHREYQTEHGRVIAAECSTLCMSLGEVSVACGYSSDYLARVCRGSLPLVRSAAVRIGAVLRIDLGGYVVNTTRAPRKPKTAPAVPDLPGVAVPVVPGIDLVMGGEYRSSDFSAELATSEPS